MSSKSIYRCLETDSQHNVELWPGRPEVGIHCLLGTKTMWFCGRLGLDYSPERAGLGDCLEEAISVGLGLPMRARVLQQLFLALEAPPGGGGGGDKFDTGAAAPTAAKAHAPATACTETRASDTQPTTTQSSAPAAAGVVASTTSSKATAETTAKATAAKAATAAESQAASSIARRDTVCDNSCGEKRNG